MSLEINRSQSTIDLLRTIRNQDPRDRSLIFPQDREISVHWEDARSAQITKLDAERLDILTPSPCESGEQYLGQVIKRDFLLADLAMAVALMDQEGQVFLDQLPERAKIHGVRIGGMIIQWAYNKHTMIDHLVLTKVEGYWDFMLSSAQRFYDHEPLDTLIYRH